MDRLDLNTPSDINGLLFGADGKITAFTICTNKMMQVICHGLSEHYVTFQGGFHAGKDSYATTGVALGKNAVVEKEGETVDAIQLGTGTNSEALTLKVYNHKLLGSDGKIPSERLPNLNIEMEIVNNVLSWRYVGDTTWIPLLDLTNLQGEDGQSFQVDEYGDFNEAKIIEISNAVTTGRYLFLVNPLGDIRVNNTTPASLNGDMSRHILMYDGDETAWYDYGEFTGLQGEPGKPVQLQNNGTYIQWKYTTDVSWNNLVALSALKGDKGDKGDDGEDGATLELDGTDANYIRWRVVGDVDWINLLNKSEIKGAKGDAGDDGTEVEFRVFNNTWLQWRYVGESTWTNSYDLRLLDIVDNNWTLDSGILSPTVPTTRIRTSVAAVGDDDVLNKKFFDDNKSTSKGNEFNLNVSDGSGDFQESSIIIDADSILASTNVSNNLLLGEVNVSIGSSGILTLNTDNPYLKANFVPTLDHHISNKKYVDDSIPDITGKADKTNVLELDNTTEFTPDGDYEPATKKYVDDNSGGGEHNTIDSISLDGTTLTPDIDKNVEITLLDKYVSLDQTQKQTLTESPIFGNLTPKRLVFVDEDGSLIDTNLFWDSVGKKFGINGEPTTIFDVIGDYIGGQNNLIPQMSVKNIAPITSTYRYAYINTMIGNGFPYLPHIGVQAMGRMISGVAGGETAIRNYSKFPFYIYTDNTNRALTILPDGKVGISTILPKKGLEVGSDAGYVSSIDEGTGDTDFASHKFVNDSISAIVSSQTVTSSATVTPTGNKRENEVYITAQSKALTIANPSGTPVNGNTLLIRIKDDGTAREITWGNLYKGFSYDLPATTILGKEKYIGFIYNSNSVKWDLVSITDEI